jgi:3',5'-cyclic AMP phosphodiesterase CpdA
MTTKFITNNTETSFWLISDPHLIADSLHPTDGPAFQRMRDTSAGKDLDYQEIALSAFVNKMIKFHPTALIITGDITFNGALISAQRFSQLMQPLIKQKIAVLVIPGNHDIFDGWARKFVADVEYRTKEISPQTWRQIFSYSYSHAVKKDVNSLAYSVNFNPNYRLIMADSNKFGRQPSLMHPKTSGKISSAQLHFIKSELLAAQKQGQHVLFFMHHNLYTHNMAVSEGFVLDNAAELRRLLRKYQVKVVFSGHIHAQSILPPQKDCSATEIVSSCFASTDEGYGVVSLKPKQVKYQRYSFDIENYLTAEQRKNQDLNHFHAYLKDIFIKANQKQVVANFGRFIKDPAMIKEILRILSRIQWLYFTGASFQNKTEVAKLKNSYIFQMLIKRMPALRKYLISLTDTHCDSSYCQIDYED